VRRGWQDAALARQGRRPARSLGATNADATHSCLCAQIFVFFPEEEKVGVKRIKVRRRHTLGSHARCWAPLLPLLLADSACL
jgi:hypothetical protein